MGRLQGIEVSLSRHIDRQRRPIDRQFIQDRHRDIQHKPIDRQAYNTNQQTDKPDRSTVTGRKADTQSIKGQRGTDENSRNRDKQTDSQDKTWEKASNERS